MSDRDIFEPTPEALVDRLALISAREAMRMRNNGERTHEYIKGRAIVETIHAEILPLVTGRETVRSGSGYVPPYNADLAWRFQTTLRAELERMRGGNR